MQKTILLAVLIGLASGLLAGVYHNVFTVPVIEQAIVLEEERAIAELPSGQQPVEEPPLVSLGMQRIGMAIGTALYGAVLGLVFAGAYSMLRWMMQERNRMLLAFAAALIGFWAISLLPFLKYPLVPPGVGDEGTLVVRQGVQTLFFIISAGAVVALLLAYKDIRTSSMSAGMRQLVIGASVAVYAVFMALLFVFLPSNPDPVPVPDGLLFNFRALTLVGQLLTWVFIAIGFAYYLKRSEKRREYSTRHG